MIKDTGWQGTIPEETMMIIAVVIAIITDILFRRRSRLTPTENVILMVLWQRQIFLMMFNLLKKKVAHIFPLMS